MKRITNAMKILSHGGGRVKTPILEDMMKPQNPIIKRDAELGWEIFVPEGMLPCELKVISISPAGLYLETYDETWDLLPFDELRDLLDDGGRTLDESIEMDPVDRNRTLISKLTCPVNVVAGQPSDYSMSMPTGQERAYRRWDADQRYEYTYPGGR